MDIKNIIGCLSSNGISFPPEFATVEKDGCIAEFDGLMKSNLEHIDSLVRYGINNGFSGDLKAGITKLTKMAVRICEEKKAKKYDKLSAELAKINKEVDRGVKVKEDQFDMVGEVNKHINTYIKGTNVLLGMDVASDRKHILVKGNEKLNEIKQVLKDVTDVSTTDALEHAKVIIGELQEWSDVVSDKMHDETDLEILDKALEHAKSWKNVHTAVKTGLFVKSNKVKDINEIVYKDDNLGMIAKSESVINDINIFMNNLEDYKNAMQTHALSTDDAEKELQAKKDEKTALSAKKKELVVQFQNGEISKQDLYDECIAIDEQVEDLNEDIEELKMDIEDAKSDKRSTGKVLATLESLNQQILQYRADPIYLSIIGEELDFARLTKVMRGAGSESDIDYVLDVQTILDKVKEKRRERDRVVNEGGRNLRQLRNQRRKEARMERRASMQKDPTVVEKEQQQQDDYLANLLGQSMEKPQENTVQQEQNVNTSEENIRFVLGDEDR
ncbi:MAG: hypothetical protein IJA88_03695 [Clostridia bacterium]|nr:hypothetical protein [Clostridia bacterium]